MYGIAITYAVACMLLIVVFILFRPPSKKELKRFEDDDNWSNMGF